ncbi:hypothetical protein [Martelella sp. AD-3]|uniref:hypothetical protein n=1 Tax=Martelella sp. AD-3 TaxID=686597 RepID=UPI001FCCBCAA|nr:hypothetical protein [Martelella sp. AD-3]
MTRIFPETSVSTLRQRLIDDMNMRHFSSAIQRNYIRDIGRFTRFLVTRAPTSLQFSGRRAAYGELGQILVLTERQAIGKASKTTKPAANATGLFVSVVAGAGSNLHLLPEQVKMVAGTGIDHNLQSTPVKMVAGGCNHHYLRPTNSHFPINAKSNARRKVAKNSSFHSILFRTAA